MAVYHQDTNIRFVDRCQSENMQAELAFLRLQHHLLERSYRPFQCLQLVSVLTTHLCALLRLYVWVRHCACTPHDCICGMAVNSSGAHSLSCQKSAGRGARDTELSIYSQDFTALRNTKSSWTTRTCSWRRQTTRRRGIDAMEEWSLSYMGRHFSRYSGSKLSRQSCHGSWCRGD